MSHISSSFSFPSTSSSSSHCSFSQLPLELHISIIQFLSRTDLQNLSQTNRFFHSLCSTRLDRSLSISFDSLGELSLYLVHFSRKPTAFHLESLVLSYLPSNLNQHTLSHFHSSPISSFSSHELDDLDAYFRLAQLLQCVLPQFPNLKQFTFLPTPSSSLIDLFLSHAKLNLPSLKKLTCYSFPRVTFLHSPHHFNHLTHLSFIVPYLPPHFAFVLKEHAKNLTHLTISTSKLGPDHLHALWSLHSLKTLSTLVVTGHFIERIFDPILDMSSHVLTLNKLVLNLSFKPLLNRIAHRHLSPFLKAVQTNVFQYIPTEERSQFLVLQRSIPYIPSVQQLKLANIVLKWIECSSLFNNLCSLTLTKCHLRGPLEPASSSSFGTPTPTFPKLHSLSLHSISIKSDQLISFLNLFPNLTSLSIESTPALTDFTLATVLLAHPKLVSLHLKNNPMLTKSCAQLFTVLPLHCQLHLDWSLFQSIQPSFHRKSKVYVHPPRHHSKQPPSSSSSSFSTVSSSSVSNESNSPVIPINANMQTIINEDDVEAMENVFQMSNHHGTSVWPSSMILDAPFSLATTPNPLSNPHTETNTFVLTPMQLHPHPPLEEDEEEVDEEEEGEEEEGALTGFASNASISPTFSLEEVEEPPSHLDMNHEETTYDSETFIAMDLEVLSNSDLFNPSWSLSPLSPSSFLSSSSPSSSSSFIEQTDEFMDEVPEFYLFQSHPPPPPTPTSTYHFTSVSSSSALSPSPSSPTLPPLSLSSSLPLNDLGMDTELNEIPAFTLHDVLPDVLQSPSFNEDEEDEDEENDDSHVEEEEEEEQMDEPTEPIPMSNSTNSNTLFVSLVHGGSNFLTLEEVYPENSPHRFHLL